MTKRELWFFLSCLITAIQICPIVPYSCKSISGSEVDWFVAYKLPTLKPSKDPRLSAGTAFLYTDSKAKSWVFSDVSVAERTSAIGITVSQVFKAKNDKTAFFALYNDEDPNSGKTDSGRAHMKGLVVSDDINGFWLVHSVPKFPITTGSGYAYPESGKRNGQSFLCISFVSHTLTEIGKQLFVSQPNVYDAHLPDSFARLFPDLANAVNRKPYPTKSPPSSIIQFQSAGQVMFTSFSKHKRFGRDLYSELVSPKLHSSLFLETWMVGGGDIPSNCDTVNKIHNIRSMNFTQTPGVNFLNLIDHSKWAVSAQPDDWICIGDINHQESQGHRGGGTVCMKNPKIASLYRSAIDDVECCPNETACRANKNG